MVIFSVMVSAASSDSSGTRTLLFLLIVVAVVLIVAGGAIALFTWSRQRKASNDYLSAPNEIERR
jgi:flagellar basal body-associated protein FliL